MDDGELVDFTPNEGDETEDIENDSDFKPLIDVTYSDNSKPKKSSSAPVSPPTSGSESSVNARSAETFSKSIVAIFSAAFDKNSGPVIEWQYPGSALVNLDGVEFSALPSGSHDHEGLDLIYFTKPGTPNQYGMCAYLRTFVGGVKSRDTVVMRSIGVLCEHYSVLYEHKTFLDQCVKNFNSYDLTEENALTMITYFNQYNQKIQSLSSSSLSSSFLLASNLPSGAFSYLFTNFGTQLFVLWKALILQKRVLMCAEPPVRIPSLMTYAAMFLTRNSVKGTRWKHLLDPNPIFYINLATQMKFVQTQQHYIACTTDKIFERKQHVYDVYCNIYSETNKNKIGITKKVEISVNDPGDKDIINLTEGDAARYQFIVERFQAADEGRVLSFIMELNNKLFYALNKSSKTNESVGPSEMPKFGLDPSDFPFFQELTRAYNLDITPVTPCCYGCCL